MPRILHGDPLPVDDAVEVISRLLPRIADAQPELAEELGPTLAAVTANLQAFDFLFPDLQGDPNNLLPAPPEATDTPTKLAVLGRAMVDLNDLGPSADSEIPAVYTYVGQFIDHDITLETGTPKASAMVNNPNLVPLDPTVIANTVKNVRTGALDLDSVYNLDATDTGVINGDKLVIGMVEPISADPPGCSKPVCRPPRSKGDDANDLPRKPRAANNPQIDREAKIGDHRNDENLIISQLHLAFLRAHNAIVDMGLDFAGAQKMLRQHYQHIVLHDFLPRMADTAVVNDVLQNGNSVYDPDDQHFFMPLEFSFAVYRFGHTMIRDDYNFNLNFNRDDAPVQANLFLLFTFTALSGQLAATSTPCQTTGSSSGTGSSIWVPARLRTSLAGSTPTSPSRESSRATRPRGDGISRRRGHPAGPQSASRLSTASPHRPGRGDQTRYYANDGGGDRGGCGEPGPGLGIARRWLFGADPTLVLHPG